MGKYDFIKTEHVVPVKKTYDWTYEIGYGGETKTISINVYPYTVEEKLELQTATKKAQDLMKSTVAENNEKGAQELQEITDKSAWYILKKDSDDVQLETVKKLPTEVKTDIMYMALEFEGFKRETLEAQSKKAVDELQK